MKKGFLSTVGEAIGITPLKDDEYNLPDLDYLDDEVDEVDKADKKSFKEELEDAAADFVSDEYNNRFIPTSVGEEAFVDEETESEADAAKAAEASAEAELAEGIKNATSEIAQSDAKASTETQVEDGSSLDDNDEKIIKEAWEEAAAAEREKMRETHKKTLDVLKPVVAVTEEGDKMQTRKFYEELGDLAYEFDRSGDLDARLADYVASVVARDGALVDAFIDKYLPDFIMKNPGKISAIESYIRTAAEGNIDLTVVYLNPRTEEFFDSWDGAVSSIQDDLDKYPDINPENVFRKTWFKVDSEGHLGKEPISEEEVEKYIDQFRGDKVALRRKLDLPKKDGQKKSSKSDGKADKVDTGKSSKPNSEGKSAGSEKSAKSSKKSNSIDPAPTTKGA